MTATRSNCASQGETAINLDLMLRVDKQFLETPSDGIHRPASKAPSHSSERSRK
jgi:hypothetical protein